MTDKNDVHSNDHDENIIEEGAAEGTDEPELEDIEATEKTKLKQLRDKLKACQEDKRQILEDAQRSRADFLNAKQRLAQEKQLDHERTRLTHIEELLPLCDSFDMAIADRDAWETAPEKWRKGIEGIHSQLRTLLQSYGVSILDPTGEPFDPQRHEAVGQETVNDEKERDTIIRTVQKGYLMAGPEGERLIRPARVIVGSSN